MCWEGRGGGVGDKTGSSTVQNKIWQANGKGVTTCIPLLRSSFLSFRLRIQTPQTDRDTPIQHVKKIRGFPSCCSYMYMYHYSYGLFRKLAIHSYGLFRKLAIHKCTCVCKCLGLSILSIIQLFSSCVYLLCILFIHLCTIFLLPLEGP